MRVWLDDVREAPAGWARAATPEEAIELLRAGEVSALSLDHDLGLDTEGAERSGYSVLLWLERELGEGRWRFPLPSIRIHSANPVGRARMERAIASIERLGRSLPRDARPLGGCEDDWPTREVHAQSAKSEPEPERDMFGLSDPGLSTEGIVLRVFGYGVASWALLVLALVLLPVLPFLALVAGVGLVVWAGAKALYGALKGSLERDDAARRRPAA